MLSFRSLSFIVSLPVAALLTTALAAPSASATPDNARRPVILDSLGGINDGQSGTLLRTGPTSWEPIVGAQPIAAPVELAPPQSSVPMVVAPYIQLPLGGGSSPAPQPRPLPRPQ